MKCERLQQIQRIVGVWIYLGPSKVWPLEKHLQMRLCWWWNGIWIYFNPTRRELEREKAILKSL